MNLSGGEGPGAGQSESAGWCDVVPTHVRNSRVLGVEADPLRGTETILLVEDEAFVREVAREVLKAAGYRVLTAQSAAEASCVYDRCSGGIDLLLSDIVLPGEDGRSLANRLSSQNPDLQVLMVTGYAMQPGQSRPGRKDEEYLPKPFSSAILLRKVRQVLDGRKRD
jgi:two-component system cell cycle sensor histidine kinase/response regulator CckA